MWPEPGAGLTKDSQRNAEHALSALYALSALSALFAWSAHPSAMKGRLCVMCVRAAKGPMRAALRIAICMRACVNMIVRACVDI